MPSTWRPGSRMCSGDSPSSTTVKSFLRASASTSGHQSPRTTNCRAPTSARISRIGELPVIQNASHERRLDLPQTRQYRRIKEITTTRATSPDSRAPINVLAAPEPLGFTQIKYDVVFAELQNFSRVGIPHPRIRCRTTNRRPAAAWREFDRALCPGWSRSTLSS